MPNWMREYSLSIGLVFLIAAVIAIESHVAAVVLLAAGVVFLALSMLTAVSGPPGFKEETGEPASGGVDRLANRISEAPRTARSSRFAVGQFI
ncbi:MAG: hypothetical protein JRN33_01575 [Nitrososphaerota archaeon]|nr:hypothetical protein [Nitrososphaerota archaeon]